MLYGEDLEYAREASVGNFMTLVLLRPLCSGNLALVRRPPGRLRELGKKLIVVHVSCRKEETSQLLPSPNSLIVVICCTPLETRYKSVAYRNPDVSRRTPLF